MFIDEDPAPHPAHDSSGAEVGVAPLLIACAAEATRQAAEVARMDEGFGLALEASRRDGAGMPAPALGRELAASLQQIDRLRQETQGLARVLTLLARVTDRRGMLPVADVRACTPLVALQHRLLSRSLIETDPAAGASVARP